MRDAHLPIDGEHPVAGVVHLVDECLLGGSRFQTVDRLTGGIRRRSSHGGRLRREQCPQLTEQEFGRGFGRCPV